NTAQGFRSHATPRVGHLEANVAADVRFGPLLDVGHADIGPRGGDQQAAALGHGVAGVAGQVDDDEFQHRGIGVDEWQIRPEFYLERDVLAEYALQHRADMTDHFIHVHDFGHHRLLAAEGEQ